MNNRPNFETGPREIENLKILKIMLLMKLNALKSHDKNARLS